VIRNADELSIAGLTKRVHDLAPHATVETVPLAFDTSLYEMPEALPGREHPTVGLIGSFAWQPTFLAATRLLDRLWPSVVQAVPEAKLLIVGRDARRVLARYLDHPNVEIVETVPDITPYFHALDVMLYAPHKGSGMKVKVMEAFAFGTPVVTSTAGAEGIPIEDGIHAGLSDDDRGLIDRTVALLRDAERRNAQRRAARQLIERHCAPARSVDVLEPVYERCAIE
jgi:glycosyltransferase involved in cell wall biosynthesis